MTFLRFEKIAVLFYVNDMISDLCADVEQYDMCIYDKKNDVITLLKHNNDFLS